jgi:hypothetical protein
MRIGWLHDPVKYMGGAELSGREFRAAAPEGVEVVDCPPGGIETGLDTYVAHNVTRYAPEDFQRIKSAPVVWFHHDLSPWIKPGVQEWLDNEAIHLFCSPAQRDRYGLDGKCIPPALDLDRYRPTRQIRKHRKGAVSIAQWRGPGKGARGIVEWARENGPLDVYGGGDFIPFGEGLEFMGDIAPQNVANVLLNYRTFVFLPTDFEPFCRCVVEAWASGCELVVNRNIGAAYWIQEKPEALRTAASDFWSAVLD